MSSGITGMLLIKTFWCNSNVLSTAVVACIVPWCVQSTLCCCEMDCSTHGSADSVLLMSECQEFEQFFCVSQWLVLSEVRLTGKKSSLLSSLVIRK